MDTQASSAGATLEGGVVWARVRRIGLPLRARDAAFATVIALTLFVATLILRVSGRTMLDAPFMALLDHLTHRSPAFDLTVRAIDQFNIFQGVPMFALAYAAFTTAQSRVSRTKVAIACIAAAGAAVLSRLMQLGLPHLPRPLFDPSSGYRAPFGADYKALADWSSFPSDHAALFFGVALATAAGNRILGAVAVIVGAVACFARIYEGQHYPSDVLGGAFLAAACVFASVSAPSAWYAYVIEKSARHRALLVGVAFLAAAEAAALFDDVRGAATELWRHLH
jgi:undecaprenyl-diphosphatase